MKFKERFVETVDMADFYFDPMEKVFTKEYNERNISLAVQGMYRNEDYIRDVFTVLQNWVVMKDIFDECSTFDDLAEIEL
ncbi:hypothetical protein [Photobacterium damselae]|uniref:hypothetical protein n=1 Tax=Photobacterium damselae TaxID=38293 RepID=UPI000A2FDAE0|nr:hypothetical protein [Photobacterium damselae]ARR51937.1 hypothetical protein CAY62_21295 [Photobacterium damselae subsp. damselae]